MSFMFTFFEFHVSFPCFVRVGEDVMEVSEEIVGHVTSHTIGTMSCVV